jgi:hypothetical protein
MTEKQEEQMLELSAELCDLLKNNLTIATIKQKKKFEEMLDSASFFFDNASYDRSIDEMKSLIKQLKTHKNDTDRRCE